MCPLRSKKGSKIDLLSKILIFFENRQKKYFFKTSGKFFVTSKMKQNPSSCSIGIWNYHLEPSKSKSRIFPGPYGSPLWYICNAKPKRNIITSSKESCSSCSSMMQWNPDGFHVCGTSYSTYLSNFLVLFNNNFQLWWAIYLLYLLFF